MRRTAYIGVTALFRSDACGERPIRGFLAARIAAALAILAAASCGSSQLKAQAPGDSGVTGGTSPVGNSDGPRNSVGGTGGTSTVPTDGAIEAGGAIGAGGAIRAGGAIGAGGAIEAGGAIGAGGAIEAGGAIGASGAIRAGGAIGRGGAGGSGIDGAGVGSFDVAGSGGFGGSRLDVAAAGGASGYGGSGGTTPPDGANKIDAQTIPPLCGDAILTWLETCDDGNTANGDGCSADCQTIESGWQCRVPGKACTPLCGDAKIIATETCDDGNTTSGDGCSSACRLEPGASCPNPGQACIRPVCGNGMLEAGELCDCGSDPINLPGGCKAVNGLFYGDGKGCSKNCTKEPTCQDASGKTQACTAVCGDGNIDPGEGCDDGNLFSGDGCSSSCQIENGFTCTPTTSMNTSTCWSGPGQCLELPVIYRDFQPENVDGGHPDFFFLGTKFGGSTSPTTTCVPNSAGPSKGNDSTARCWGIVADTLVNGKPQPGNTKTCACQFSDWNIANSIRIPGGYTQAANDSPLSDGNGSYLTESKVSTAGAYTGTVIDYIASVPQVPIWRGTTPAYKDANSFKQWFSDDATVNKTFTGVMEMKAIGTGLYQYASASHLAQGGFFPLDVLNPSQATLCNLWPYWKHGNGNLFWGSCQGDQYLFPPRIFPFDCVAGDLLADGCWVTNVPGMKHDSYFTDEARTYFAYDGVAGFALSFFGDDDLFIFINGQLVLDLGGVHMPLPGKVIVRGDPGVATIVEGGCLDAAGNIQGAVTGSKVCSPTNVTAPAAATPDDFRTRTVNLGLVTGKVYEIAIFGADRHPPESNYMLTIQGSTNKRSSCQPRCGDGIVTAGEECDCGDGSSGLPVGCPGPNSSTTYGGCTTQCRLGSYCGDGMVSAGEECDQGKNNGIVGSGGVGCTAGCMRPHFCGDGIVDPSLGEACDLGTANGLVGQACDRNCRVMTPPGTGGAIGTGGAPGSGGAGGGPPYSPHSGTTVVFDNGRGIGAMTGYGQVDFGVLDAVTDPTCGPSRTAITVAPPCIAGINWSSSTALCMSGVIPKLPALPVQRDYDDNWGEQVGVNVTDPAGGVLGQSFSTIRIAVTGAPLTGLRARVHRRGDPASSYYCAYMIPGMAIALTSFNTYCWDGSGTALTAADIPNIDSIFVVVSSGAAAIPVTNLCLTGITFA